MFYHQSPNPYLVTSTLTFVIPLYYANLLQIWSTQYVFGSLIIASSAYHMTKHPLLYYTDQCMVAALIYRSIIDGLAGGHICTSITAFINILCGYLYYYGRLKQSLIWSPDFYTATASHACMHSLVAIGYTTLLYFYPMPRVH